MPAGMARWEKHFGRLTVFIKADSTIALLGSIPNRMHTCGHQEKCTRMTIVKNEKPNCFSTLEYIVVFSYIGILCSYENEQILTKYNNMDASHKHLIDQRKSEAKRPQTT